MGEILSDTKRIHLYMGAMHVTFLADISLLKRFFFFGRNFIKTFYFILFVYVTCVHIFRHYVYVNISVSDKFFLQ